MMTEFATVQPTEQILTFIYAFIYGGILCSFYDVLRGTRLVFRPSSLALFFQDTLYCIISAILVFCFLLVRCEGQLRIYVLLSLAFGFVGERTFISRWMVMAVATLCRLIQHTTNKTHNFSAGLWAKCKNILKRKKKPLEKQTKVDV